MAWHCVIVYCVYEFYGKAGADLISNSIVRQNLEKKQKVPSPNPAPQAIVDIGSIGTSLLFNIEKADSREK